MVENDIKNAIAIYVSYQKTGMPFYKMCCMHDLIYTYSCKGPVVGCPYYFAKDLWHRDCVLCSRLNVIK
jgi:hypothetical protein